MSLRPERIGRRAGAAGAAIALTLAIVARAVLPSPDDLPAGPQEGAAPPPISAPKPGLQLHDPRAFPGYTLIAPLNSTKSYLIDMQGRVVRSWASRYMAGQDAYLLEDGHLLRAARLDPREQHFAGGGQGGRVQEFDWDGRLAWDFKFHDETRVSHHDIGRLPGGNVLLIVWEIRTADDALAAGRRPESVHGPWLADSLVEVKPTGKTTGEVVWEWHAWDHLIQDVDPSKPHYGDVARHPERIDVNFGVEEMGFPFGPPGPPPRDIASKDAPKEDEATTKRELDRLRSIGYVGNPTAPGNRGLLPDWTHVNSVAYNAELDQIMISVRSFGEFWIIDHGTTTAEAAGHAGGRRGKGGDLLYRWGNPMAYRTGTLGDQRLFAQHDAHWIPAGTPGAGHVLVFNNGRGRLDGNYSTVDEVVPPVDARGDYARTPGAPFGPVGPIWSYPASGRRELYGPILSGANRLPNGNTLVCKSLGGTIFEVTPGGETVWKYVNPAGVSSPSVMPIGLPNSLSGNTVFRAYRYATDYPGLAGKDLTPGQTVEELERERPEIGGLGRVRSRPPAPGPARRPLRDRSPAHSASYTFPLMVSAFP